MFQVFLVPLVALTGFQADLSHAAGFTVRCQPLVYDEGIGGTADLERKEILLSSETCRNFKRGGMRRLDSLVTLGHERQHLLGVTDEREADCEAIWDVRWLARRLGYRISRTALMRYAGKFYAPCVS